MYSTHVPRDYNTSIYQNDFHHAFCELCISLHSPSLSISFFVCLSVCLSVCRLCLSGDLRGSDRGKPALHASNRSESDGARLALDVDD